MAVTTAVVNATLRHAETLEQARETIHHRITALAKAQSILNDVPIDIDVEDTVRQSISAHMDNPERFRITGPKLQRCRLPTGQAILPHPFEDR